MRKLLLSTILMGALLSNGVIAEESPAVLEGAAVDRVVTLFSQCDADFLVELYEKGYQHPQLKRANRDKIAWFEVDERTDSDQHSLIFDTPLVGEQLSILGYYDSVIDLNDYEMGSKYHWGFYLQETPEQVVSYFADYEWYDDQGFYVTKAQWYNPHSKEWEEGETAKFGEDPGEQMKRQFYVTREGERTVAVCTIQGEVQSNLLIKHRPDLFGAR